jgi:hypothetical protein
MSQYFEKLPTINYQGRDVKDITRRVSFMKKTISNPFVFLPYTIEDGDRAEDIAYYYYGSTDYTWLVYLSNNILDPYHDWPLTQENFDGYLIEKYREQSGRSGYEVINWTQDETIDDNVLYYYIDIEDTVEDVSQSIEASQQQITTDTVQASDFDNTTVDINGVSYTLIKN